MGEAERVWRELTRLTERLREINARKQAAATRPDRRPAPPKAPDPGARPPTQ